MYYPLYSNSYRSPTNKNKLKESFQELDTWSTS
jgi:hypothetical protein